MWLSLSILWNHIRVIQTITIFSCNLCIFNFLRAIERVQQIAGKAVLDYASKDEKPNFGLVKGLQLFSVTYRHVFCFVLKIQLKFYLKYFLIPNLRQNVPSLIRYKNLGKKLEVNYSYHQLKPWTTIGVQTQGFFLQNYVQTKLQTIHIHTNHWNHLKL